MVNITDLILEMMSLDTRIEKKQMRGLQAHLLSRGGIFGLAG